MSVCHSAMVSKNVQTNFHCRLTHVFLRSIRMSVSDKNKIDLSTLTFL